MKHRIGIVQMNSSADLRENMRFARQQIEQGSREDLDLIAFPETFLYVGNDHRTLCQDRCPSYKGILNEIPRGHDPDFAGPAQARSQQMADSHPKMASNAMYLLRRRHGRAANVYTSPRGDGFDADAGANLNKEILCVYVDSSHFRPAPKQPGSG